MYRAICIGLCLLILTGCKPAEKSEITPKSKAVSKVQVYKLTPQVWRQTIRTYGVLEAAETVTLSSEFSAKVVKTTFEEGQEIQAGQKMIELDQTEQQILVKQAEAAIQSARIKLNEAGSLVKRREELYAKGLVSQEEIEVFRTTLANSETQLELATIGQSLAQNNMKRASIISSVSGRVVTKSVEVGEMAMPGSSLAVIQVTDTMRVVTHVTEQEINAIQVGSECIVTTPGVRGRKYIANVESRGGEVDPTTGNFPVKLTVENSDKLLRSGMTAVVIMTGLEIGDALLIPDSALVDRNRKRVVFRVKDGVAEEVEPVLAATLSDDYLPVLHGLLEGEQIIIGGLDTVVAGKKVEVINRDVKDGSTN